MEYTSLDIEVAETQWQAAHEKACGDMLAILAQHGMQLLVVDTTPDVPQDRHHHYVVTLTGPNGVELRKEWGIPPSQGAPDISNVMHPQTIGDPSTTLYQYISAQLPLKGGDLDEEVEARIDQGWHDMEWEMYVDDRREARKLCAKFDPSGGLFAALHEAARPAWTAGKVVQHLHYLKEDADEDTAN